MTYFNYQLGVLFPDSVLSEYLDITPLVSCKYVCHFELLCEEIHVNFMVTGKIVETKAREERLQ